MKFLKHDRVVAMVNNKWQAGIVKEISMTRVNGTPIYELGIHFDYYMGGHNLSGEVDCPHGYGWYITSNKVRLETPTENRG